MALAACQRDFLWVRWQLWSRIIPVVLVVVVGGGDDNKVSRNTLSLRSPAPACSRYLSGTSETQPPKQILSPCMSVAALLAGTQTHNEWLLKTPYPLFPFGECASVVSERSSTCSRPSLGGFLFTGVVSH